MEDQFPPIEGNPSFTAPLWIAGILVLSTAFYKFLG